MTFIPYGKQDIRQNDIDAVVEVLQSDLITQGPVVPAFERGIADYVQATYCVATSSATSALHLACVALDVGPGDTVWTSPITFVASANCARYCGASVDFVDIDPDTFNLCPTQLRQKLEKHQQCGRPLPKVIIAVHMAGQSCDMESIRALADEFQFRIIEDASHAIGGRYQGKPVGNCQYSDITVFSFHPVKIITTAEGGAATTNDDELAKRMSRLRSHDVTRAPSLWQNHDIATGDWYYEQHELGFNYRLTELQAALGLSQLGRLDEYIQQRHDRVRTYNEALSHLPITLPNSLADAWSSYHLYIVQCQQGPDVREQLFNALRTHQIGVNVHYIPVHLQPYYRQFGFTQGDFPNAEHYYERAISLPMYPTLTVEEQQHVIDVITSFFEGSAL